jgi:hypothetical protein
LPEDLRRVTAEWYWTELTATGSANPEWDPFRRFYALDGLYTLAEKNGPDWVLALFKQQGREEFLKRVDAARVGLKPKEVEAGRRLLARFKSR